jgi:tRNA A-37 threonylcarbamoyl transferase component Bud32
MLTSSDIISGKMVVQLGLAPDVRVRAELRNLDAGMPGGATLLERLQTTHAIDAAWAASIKQRVALYESARGQSSYARLVQRTYHTSSDTLNQLIATFERNPTSRRFGDLLIEQRIVTAEQHRALAQKTRQTLQQEDQKVIERYRKEDWAGVGRPLIPGSKLEAADFRIAKLPKEAHADAHAGHVPSPPSIAQAGHTPTPFSATTTPPPFTTTPIPADPPTSSMPRVAIPHARHTPAPPPAPAPVPAPAHAHAHAKKKPDGPPAVAPLGMDAVRQLKRISDYTIVEVLGAGGMGAVFLGQKDGHSIYAAIKVMLNQAATEEEKKRFLREISLTRRIKHKNVIDILDSGDTPDGLTFLVVPALVAKELRALIDATKGQGLAPDLACRLFEGILEGLQAIHDAEIIHRDMKPGNVMVLSGASGLKIMDLGLARYLGEADPADAAASFQTMTRSVVGSPTYIAPETISSEPLDNRTDIYSAGVIFFEMLTGKPPFESQNTSGLLTQHLAAPPPDLSEVQPGRAWPKEADELIQKMMGKTKEERPASCREVLAILRGGLSAKLAQMSNAPPAVAEAKVEIAEAPPATAKIEKSAWGVAGILGRLMGKGR